MFSLSLQIQIFLGMLLGAFVGLFFGESTFFLDSLGQAFIMLIKMTVLPYLSLSLIHGLGRLSLDEFKTIAKKGANLVFIFWAITIFVIYAISTMYVVGGAPGFYSELLPDSDVPNSILHLLIPQNPFKAFATDAVPGIVLFSLLFGIALMQVQGKGSVLDVFETIISALLGVTRWVICLSPIGVFALVAVTVGTVTFHDFESIAVYLFAYIVTTLLFVLWIYPSLVSSLTPVGKQELLRELRPALLLSFTTATVFVLLPIILEAVVRISERQGINSKKSRSTAGTLVPLFFNLPSAGNLMLILFILFLSSFYRQEILIWKHVELVSLSFLSLFGGASVTFQSLPFLLDRMHLPQDGFALFIGTYPMIRHFQALLSSAGIAAIVILVHFATQGLLTISGKKILKSIIGSISLLMLCVFGAFYFLPVPKQNSNVFVKLELKEKVMATVKQTLPGETNHTSKVKYQSAFERIQKTGVLRIGFNVKTAPFVYFNEYGNLVGYDIAIAHKLARQLDCRIEFIPFSYESISRDLRRGSYDIAMSAISVTGDRLKRLSFSEPYMTVEKALVVPDYLRSHFIKADELKLVDGMRIAALKGSAYVKMARENFPLAKIIEISHYDEFAEGNVAEALFWTKEEGTTWALKNPLFTAVTLNPSLGSDYYAYAVSKESEEFLSYVNYWLDLKKLDGTLKKEYDYWILGEEIRTEPRWSIMRNVLNWVD